MVKFDWAFTEDGDLSAGEPLLNENGQIVYLHSDGTRDTDKREDGIEIRDIGVVEDIEAEKQIVFNRLRTDSPDWYHHPGMGGNLSDLVGEPNTRATAEQGIAYITNALTYGNLYSRNQLSVRGVPIGPDKLVFMIDISKYGNKVTRLPLVFNLQSGLMDFYETPKQT
jgi:hypothetical protein